MRKLIVTEFISLDGVMEAPGGEPGYKYSGWCFDNWSQEAGEYKFGELKEAGAHLLGRKTYEGFAKAWPEMKDESGFADRMNALPKFVVSNSLSEKDLTWQGTTQLKGDAVEAVKKLKEGDGGPLLLAGSAQLAHSLLTAGLVDELRLMVHPMLLGTGKRIYPDDAGKLNLRLLKTVPLPNNVQVLVYSQTMPESGEEVVPGMKRIRKSITIQAPTETVWNVLFNGDGAWLKKFHPQSKAEGTYAEGSLMQFTAGTDGGMLMKVVANKPHTLLDMTYEGTLINGKMDTESRHAQSIKAGHETYRLAFVGRHTRLDIESDMGADWYEPMAKAWDEALQEVKRQAEA